MARSLRRSRRVVEAEHPVTLGVPKSRSVFVTQLRFMDRIHLWMLAYGSFSSDLRGEAQKILPDESDRDLVGPPHKVPILNSLYLNTTVLKHYREIQRRSRSSSWSCSPTDVSFDPT